MFPDAVFASLSQMPADAARFQRSQETLPEDTALARVGRWAKAALARRSAPEEAPATHRADELRSRLLSVSSIITAVKAGRLFAYGVYALAYGTHAATLVLAAVAAARASTREEYLALFPVVLSSLLWLAAVNALRVKLASRQRADARIWAWSGGLIIAGLVLLRLRAPFPALTPATFLAAVFLLTISHDWPASAALVTAFGLASVLVGVASGFEHTTAAFLFVALYLPAAAYVQSLRSGMIDQANRFDHARWAASELSNVVMRLDSSVNRARVSSLLEERRRVAREIHDTVGYALTALIVQLSLLKEIVGASEPADRVARLETMVRDALDEIRLKVTELRSPGGEQGRNWREVWLRLASTFSECTAVRVHADIDDPVERVDDRVGETIYKILQESLTNAYRHGKATYVFMGVRHKRELGKILVKVSDNGSGCAELHMGNGLAGLRERVAGHGGTVTWDTRAGQGFDIGIDIPWEGYVGKNPGSDRG